MTPGPPCGTPHIHWVRLFVLALLVGACDPTPRRVPAAPVVDAGCEPMPATCPETLECELVPETLTCTGPSCCAPFCADNGCTRCCAARE